jgi:hypothetical protein
MLPFNLLWNYLGVCAAAHYICYFYFEVLVEFCVANEDWETFDFSDAFPIWAHVDHIYFKFFVKVKWVINTFAAVFCVSWGSFFWANRASSSLLRT